MFWLLLALAIYLCVKIATADMRRRIIPDAYLFPLMIIGAIMTTFFPWPHDIGAGVIGMTFGYIMAAVIGLIFDWFMTRRNPAAETPIGMGDIKLIAVGGLWCGPAGLGIAFLRHIERTRLLLHVVDMSGMEGRDPIEDYEHINHELSAYGDLNSRPQIIAANKKRPNIYVQIR